MKTNKLERELKKFAKVLPVMIKESCEKANLKNDKKTINTLCESFAEDMNNVLADGGTLMISWESFDEYVLDFNDTVGGLSNEEEQ